MSRVCRLVTFTVFTAEAAGGRSAISPAILTEKPGEGVPNTPSELLFSLSSGSGRAWAAACPRGACRAPAPICGRRAIRHIKRVKEMKRKRDRERWTRISDK